MHWRHERLSVTMALADALHHSAQPRAKPGEAEQYDAPRRQMTPPDRVSGVLRVVSELRRVGWLPAAASRGGTAAGVRASGAMVGAEEPREESEDEEEEAQKTEEKEASQSFLWSRTSL